MYTRIINNKKRYKGEVRVYTGQALLLDQEGGESEECLEDDLGLFGVSAGQTAAPCGPWQLAHL